MNKTTAKAHTWLKLCCESVCALCTMYERECNTFNDANRRNKDCTKQYSPKKKDVLHTRLNGKSTHGAITELKKKLVQSSNKTHDDKI